MKKYSCSICGAKDIKPFSNGDGKHICETCATERYLNTFPYGMPILKEEYRLIGLRTDT